ncbi:NAD(P)H-hydrate dehydratase [Sphingorhabdus sp.]|uniref:NAD(P)H-hydrate dehydratase n=1 Tax=Sphingorhabdus sp. TaxID=1902408 RepID=UPI00391AC8CD
MAEAIIPLDSNWLRAHPLPVPAHNTDKNARGRVCVVGGSRMVPGGVALTAEAALRAGAGKVRVATIASCAIGLGIALPEVGILALDETSDGHVDISRVAPEHLPDHCDALVLGPAMWSKDAAADLIAALIVSHNDDANSPVYILDAAALGALPAFAETTGGRRHPLVLTPHAGELADLTGYSAEEIDADPCGVLREAVETFDAVVMLKGATSYVSAPGEGIYGFAGGGAGLATGGSGDVLAGIVAGLAARGAPPFEALLWAIWLHGEAGRRCAEQIGSIGYLSRELLVRIPGLMHAI